MNRILFVFLPAMMFLTMAANPAAAQTSTANPLMPGTIQYVAPEFRLNADGTMLVRGIVVNTVSSSSLQGVFRYGAWLMPITVNADASTMVFDRALGSIGLSDIRPGDTISFAGQLMAQPAQNYVLAQVIRDWTPALVGGSATGTGSTIPGTTSPSPSINLPSSSDSVLVPTSSGQMSTTSTSGVPGY
jgi:hypothetical protein